MYQVRILRRYNLSVIQLMNDKHFHGWSLSSLQGKVFSGKSYVVTYVCLICGTILIFPTNIYDVDAKFSEL